MKDMKEYLTITVAATVIIWLATLSISSRSNHYTKVMTEKLPLYENGNMINVATSTAHDKNI